MNLVAFHAFFDELEKIAETVISFKTAPNAKPSAEIRRDASRFSIVTNTPEKDMEELSKKLAAQTLGEAAPPPPPPPNNMMKKLMGPAGGPPAVKPPKPPVAERLRTLTRKGGPLLKNIENVITAPQKPHRYLGTAYKRDFSGFKYS